MIAVDLDGTLAVYGKFVPGHIGEPIPAMVERVKQMLADGQQVCIFTARVGALFLPFATEAAKEAAQTEYDAIVKWSLKHFGESIPVTAVKQYHMRVFYDDRAIQVEPNTGRLIEDAPGITTGTGLQVMYDEIDALRNAYIVVKTERDVARVELQKARFAPMGDNHHNARACPYCNTDGKLVYLDESTEFTEEQWQMLVRRMKDSDIVADPATNTGLFTDAEFMASGVRARYAIMAERKQYHAAIAEVARLNALLRDVLNSDMAMREEDEGEVSEILNRVREALAVSQ